MRDLLLVFIFVLQCMGQTPEPQPSPLPAGGSLSGTLDGEDGTAIADAIVGLTIVPPYPAGRLRQTEWTTTSGVNGSFQFVKLPPGNYRVCAQAQGTAWLNGCEWGAQPPPLSITATGPGVKYPVVLKKGVFVPVRLNDPSGLLAQYEGKSASAQLLIGVENDASFFRTAPIVSTDSAGRNHQVLIPFGAPINLVICSPVFQLSNAAGIALPTSSTSILIFVQRGDQAQTLTLNITGVTLP